MSPTYVYSPRYALEWGEHVFPVEKYALVAERLAQKGITLVEPPPATDAELERVHTKAYLARLRELTRTPELGYPEFEVPVTERVIETFRLATGGTILAARRALEEGAAANLSGGFHHAFADHGEGFCLINDLAVAIRQLQHEGRIRRASVIDLDLHQGNGTARIFADDPSVYTFSMHQEHNYPRKERSTWDIGLDDGTGDEEYLEHVRQAVPKILAEFQPDLVLYQAGADPYREDKLGGLALSIEGLAERDRIVYRECRARRRPIAVTLGGGYARRTEDVVAIHANTLTLLAESP
ncbi:MAG: histone deacetylase [Planctomycetes bacterium]|nr:histone deacetylase [Planctomycetota bacterium]